MNLNYEFPHVRGIVINKKRNDRTSVCRHQRSLVASSDKLTVSTFLFKAREVDIPFFLFLIEVMN